MIVEGLRTDSLYLPFQILGYDIRVSQLVSAVIMLAGIILLFINRHKNDGMLGRTFKRNYKKSKKRG